MEHVASTHPWIVAVERSAVGDAMRQSVMLYPVVEVVYILGLALLVGSIAAFDLRVLGFARGVPLEPVSRVTVPLAVVGFALAVPAGLLLFTTEATHIAVNPAFQVKLAFIAVALLNVVVFRLGPWGRMDAWGRAGVRPPVGARAGAAVSLLSWIGALVGGRMIAYF